MMEWRVEPAVETGGVVQFGGAVVCCRDSDNGGHCNANKDGRTQC